MQERHRRPSPWPLSSKNVAVVNQPSPGSGKNRAAAPLPHLKFVLLRSNSSPDPARKGTGGGPCRDLRTPSPPLARPRLDPARTKPLLPSAPCICAPWWGRSSAGGLGHNLRAATTAEATSASAMVTRTAATGAASSGRGEQQWQAGRATTPSSSGSGEQQWRGRRAPTATRSERGEQQQRREAGAASSSRRSGHG